MSKPIKHHPEPSGPAQTAAADAPPADDRNWLAGLRNPAPMQDRRLLEKSPHR